MDKENRFITDVVKRAKSITRDQLERLLERAAADDDEYLFATARDVSARSFGKEIFLRGLVEFTNYCKNDCYYCGIRRGNKNAERYRLSEEEILACCEIGWSLGFKTFVLQGGEDPFFTDDRICQIVRKIKEKLPSCAVTLSVGERSFESYQRFYEAGTDRYLLRHETANDEHYGKLHPASMSGRNRKRCLRDLKEIGFQVGCGFMTGSPRQTIDHIYEDIDFMTELEPHMIGIGPFIAHRDTPFRDEPDGSVKRTLRLLSILRLIFPKALIPATTALGTLDALGREKGILAGANVLMPNLSPVNVRRKYLLYDGKICVGEEAAECNKCLRRRVERIGYHITDSRGDHPDFINKARVNATMEAKYDLSPELSDKLNKLKEYLKGLGSLAVCFSGGVDSSFLLAVASETLGDRVVAVTGVDASVPEREANEAKAFCKERGVRHILREVNPLKEDGYRNNSPNRCYFCKRGIFAEARKVADENGVEHIAEGSNMDDVGDYRPGFKAASELSVKSPLREVGLYKSDIRLISKAMGLPTWSKPAYACLASRFVYGEEITEEKLRMIDRAEQFLIERGFLEERVRIHGNVARIEVPPADIPRLASDDIRNAVYEEFKKIGFLFVTLDMKGYRTGSMNATLNIVDKIS